MKKNWDNKWYSEAFLQRLKDSARTENDGGLEYTVKCAPDAVSALGIDPRVLGGPIGKAAKGLRFVPDFVFERIRPSLNASGLSALRKSYSRVAYADCHIQNVCVKDRAVTVRDGGKIPVRVYEPSGDKTGICLFYIHGGAFIAGALEPYDEALKMFASKFGATAISVAYRLLPENAYPTLYHDCFDVLRHVHDHAGEYQISKDRIFVCGDSAGGNLAQACTIEMKDTAVIRGQLLLYPSLNMFRIEDGYFQKGTDDFRYEPTQRALSKGVVRQMQLLANFDVKKIGIVRPDRMNNPYSFGVVSRIPTFLSVGALDYLKKDAFAWAHKLKDAGAEVKMVVYNGMGHGYINAMGVFPQAEDVIDEMGEFVLSVLSRPPAAGAEQKVR